MVFEMHIQAFEYVIISSNIVSSVEYGFIFVILIPFAQKYSCCGGEHISD